MLPLPVKVMGMSKLHVSNDRFGPKAASKYGVI